MTKARYDQECPIMKDQNDPILGKKEILFRLRKIDEIVSDEQEFGQRGLTYLSVFAACLKKPSSLPIYRSLTRIAQAMNK